MATLPENSIKKTNPMFWILPPFLFAISPLLYSYSENTLYYIIGDLFFSMAFFEVGTIVILGIIYLLVNKIRKLEKGISFEIASALTSIFLLLFYVLFAPAKQYLQQLIDTGFPLAGLDHPFLIIGPDKILVALSSILFIGSIWIIRLLQKKQIFCLNKYFFILGSILVVFSLVPLVNSKQIKIASSQSAASVKTHESLPNIYYIILDTYASFDVLKNYFDYDNNDFEKYLESKDFFVARKSRCNYPITILSLSSSLNMEYHPYEQKSYSEYSKKYLFKTQLSKFALTLLNLGYTYIPIGHNFFSRPFCKNDKVIMSSGYHQSDFLWLNQLLLTSFEPIVRHWHFLPLKAAYFNTLFEFKLLENSINYLGSKFVFAHILCPHDPFVFHKDGRYAENIELQINKLSKKDFDNLKKKQFVEQLEFVTTKAKSAIDHILSNDSNAIIILQSDHGVWLNGQDSTSKELSLNKDFLAQRMPILNAYYVPAKTKELLYDSISPVNSFRVILKSVFNTNDSLLPDNHFVIWYENTPHLTLPVD